MPLEQKKQYIGKVFIYDYNPSRLPSEKARGSFATFCTIPPAGELGNNGTGVAAGIAKNVKRLVEAGYEPVFDITPKGEPARLSDEARKHFSFLDDLVE